MKSKAAFGVVGGYGATGRAVVTELAKLDGGEILIGGRNLPPGMSLAETFGRRVSAAVVDVLDAPSLDAFCGKCSVVVNCAGPVMVLEDRVAQAALRARCHYVDVAGLTLIRDRMLPHRQRIEDAGLSFVVSAGWTPGLTELIPIYGYTRAKAQMDVIESVAVYFSDSGDWSDSALRDGVWHLRKGGLPKAGYFRKGSWTAAKLSEASRKVDLGEPIGERRFSLFSMPELNEVGRSLTDCDFSSYSYLAGAWNAVAAMTIALAPLPESMAIGLLRGVFRRNLLPVRGFVVTRVSGRLASRSVVLTVNMMLRGNREYWLNGLVPATVARAISCGQVRPGAGYLAEAVDPNSFVFELRESGLEITESLDSRD